MSQKCILYTCVYACACKGGWFIGICSNVLVILEDNWISASSDCTLSPQKLVPKAQWQAGWGGLLCLDNNSYLNNKNVDPAVFFKANIWLKQVWELWPLECLQGLAQGTEFSIFFHLILYWSMTGVSGSAGWLSFSDFYVAMLSQTLPCGITSTVIELQSLQ